MDRPLHTAHVELTEILSRLPAAPPARLTLALDVPEIVQRVRSGQLPAALLDAETDSHAVIVFGGVLHVTGSNARSVLHAVYALHEALLGGTRLDDTLNLQGTFHLRERIFHARFDRWPGTRADVRFLAHLGATHCLVSHDWQGSRRSLQGYVTSPLFPHAVDAAEVASNHASLRRLIDDCTDHGLGAMLWLTELPCQGGPWVPQLEREKFLSRYDSEVVSDSGTYEGQVLCFSHARVQDFYRDLLQRFFADFPEIETLFLFGLDSSGEFCDPQTCPRCRGLSRIAQRDRLIRFLSGEGGKVRPGLRVLTTGWKWDRDTTAFLRHQRGLPAGSGVYLAAQKDGWQCERQSHDFMHEVRGICRGHGQTFIGYDNFHWGDDTVHGIGDIQDFPFGIGAKLKRWHALGADGVFDHWGNSPEDIWSNSVACRDFFLNPNADAAVVCHRLARQQFGPTIGEHILEAWRELEHAHVLLSQACLWSPEQWPGWYAGRKCWPLPGHEFGPSNLAESRQPCRTAGEHVLNPPDFAEALQAVADGWQQAVPHYERAVNHLNHALTAATDEPVFYAFWWHGNAPTPTRREHVTRQKRYVESMLAVGREIGLHFALHAVWENVGHDAHAYRQTASALLAKDAEACRRAAEYFDQLGKPRDWSAHYHAKAEAIAAYLTDLGTVN
ncbi:MAG: hypothetical protein IT582_10905 [Opitutaceae bacterium]|nr:hypothetical protein [Opitutaceae bacterium]